MHKKENVGQVELATMSFGQSFSGDTDADGNNSMFSLVNGEKGSLLIFGVAVYDAEVERKKKRFLMEKETDSF